MATITQRGNPVQTSGELPSVGARAPDFKLTKTDLTDVSMADFAGKRLILNIFPSIDTGVCAASVRRFNQEAGEQADTIVLCVSRDLPFALARFCGAEGLKNVIPLSSLRDASFGDDFGLEIRDGKMAGLLARAVVIVGADGNVAYTQLVAEITTEPDYDAALATV